MAFEITSGKIQRAQRITLYGPEGIGKSTFLSKFPGVVFIDTEGSTDHMDVQRFPPPSSWSMLLDEVKGCSPVPVGLKTLAIDTADWAESLCIRHICSTHKVTGIEDFGYGKGYTYLEEEFGKLLNYLTGLTEIGVNVVIAAHAQMRKFEQPDETGAYDRWELKLEKKTAALLKEWSDMLLFANYETFVIKGKTAMDKNKVSGGQRVMYAAHNPCWDAKNRHGLPDKNEFDFSIIAPFIPAAVGRAAPQQPAAPADIPDIAAMAGPVNPPEAADAAMDHETEDAGGIPKALVDLMAADAITEREVQHAVGVGGYYPDKTPIENYDPAFVSGVLVAAWGQVKTKIMDLRETEGEKHER